MENPTTSPGSSKRFMQIQLALADYPMLSKSIRERMREELIERDIVKEKDLEETVKNLAIMSQNREGFRNPEIEESADAWQERLSKIRDNLTDLRFSQQLSFENFQQILSDILMQRGAKPHDLTHNLNLELAPMELVFDYAETLLRLPEDERQKLDHRLQEAKVALIRTLISDQLRYIRIARDWLTIDDLAEIRRHKIGAGRVGGKAAGLILAYTILNQVADEETKTHIQIPESYYVGSGEYYTFMAYNDLGNFNNQKYKTEEQMRFEYPEIVQKFETGTFPFDTLEKLRLILESAGKKPLIVRSSSLLEDNFDRSFAGKYESVFLPNQRSLEENLKALVKAMGHIYASTLNPAALLYRRSMELVDYDERMALLIQVVQGEVFGRYYLPHAAGVAFSHNTYRWSPRLSKEDGLVRLVWGFGTRAVERVGNDYPRMVALSHPLLQPSTDPKAINSYSQQYVDVIDLEENDFKTLPIQDVLTKNYPQIRQIAQIYDQGYFQNIKSRVLEDEQSKLVLTFEPLLIQSPFPKRMKKILKSLESAYGMPVDLEFTLQFVEGQRGQPNLNIHLLQCRPQSRLKTTERWSLPANLSKQNIIFSTHFVVPDGFVTGVKYVIYVSAEGYYSLKTQQQRNKLVKAISALNSKLPGKSFILVGPGRWGSSNADLGVPINYGDIYGSAALVEVTGSGIGVAPEPSLGTHFFQDLMEAQIYPLAIDLNDTKTRFSSDFFNLSKNVIEDHIEIEGDIKSSIKMIKVEDYKKAHHLAIVMDETKSSAVAYLAQK